MNSRDAQDVILRLLADGPFRAAALAGSSPLDSGQATVLSKVDHDGLERFGRFLCRHYYRERIVHFYKYSRALAPVTGRAPDAVLKTPAFSSLMPRLVLGDRASAQLVGDLLRHHLTADADSIRVLVPYWDDLVAYQGVFFLSDALPASQSPAPFPARADTASILRLEWDLPAVLPSLLRPFSSLPVPEKRTIRLLFARSLHGEVAVVRCTEALKDLLDNLTGEQDPGQLAARLKIAPEVFQQTVARLEKMGAVVSQGSFSGSHLGSAAESS